MNVAVVKNKISHPEDEPIVEEYSDIETVTADDRLITIEAFDGMKAEYNTAEWTVQCTSTERR